MKFRKIGIVGTGYIGTVIACVLADQGLEITAIDTNESRINDLLNKKLGINEPGLEEMFKRNYNKIEFSSNIDQLQDSEVILVTVGTPLDENLNADLSSVEEVARNLAGVIKKNTLICLKSTVVPGTSERFCEEIERISDLKIGEDFFFPW